MTNRKDERVDAPKNSKAIRISPVPGETATYTIFEEGLAMGPGGMKATASRVGYMVVTLSRGVKKNGLLRPDGSREEAIIAHLHHVWTAPKCRRQGNARTLLEALKEHAQVIYAEPLTPEGGQLIKACGFDRAKNAPMYRWVRGEKKFVIE